MSPFLFGEELCLPDFHLFHIFELGKTFSEIFDLPTMDLASGHETLQRFYDAMAERPSTKEILEPKAQELPLTRCEIFEEFGKAYEGMLREGKQALEAMFGHEV